MHEFPIPSPARESYTKHRRDVIWQIILPVMLAALVGIGTAVLAGIAAFNWGGDVSRWAAAATIWLVAPVLILALVLLVAAWAMVYLLGRLLKITPKYTGLAQSWILWLNAEIVLWTERILNPILAIKSWLGLFSREK
jgi:predicted PurR-regulated permease PerM